MCTKRNITWIMTVLALAMVVALPACKEEKAATSEPAADVAGEAADTAIGGVADAAGEIAGAAEEAVDAAKESLLAKLAEADAYDGTEDKVVSKCLMCGLRMDGNAANKAEFEGYTFHFCKEGCMKSFNEDAGKAVLALVVPGE